MQRAADEPDEPLHDPQVIKHGHQRREKDDDRQHVDRETETDDIRVRQRAEHHVDARLGVTDDGEDAGAQPANRCPARLEIQHERGDRGLQGERRNDDSQVDSLAVAGERNGNNQNHDDAKDSDQVTRHGGSPGVGLVVLVGCKDTPKSGIPIENLVNDGPGRGRVFG